jgi:hypothetical protein
MHTYRAEFIGSPPTGWTNDDMLANVISTVSSLTLLDVASVKAVGRGLVRVKVHFQGLNDYEAANTAETARALLPTPVDVLLARNEHGWTAVDLDQFRDNKEQTCTGS